MSPASSDTLSDTATAPAQIDREALRELRLLDGERILRVWKTGRGFLVMTNLRCVEVSRKPQLFARSDWEVGPNFFFYNLGPPKVELHRFLRLAEEHEDRAVVTRLILHDPATVAQEIQEARLEGQNEWLRRRARAEASIRESRERLQSGRAYATRDGVREVIKVRCGFCGNLMAATATRCPSCGAPQR
jgi:hypothetical protein